MKNSAYSHNRKSVLEMKLATIKKIQLHGVHISCPRCGKDKMNSNPMRNALSRHADVYICDDCGMDEALRHFMGCPLPLEEWEFGKMFLSGGAV